jgi:hypothetical protein
LTNLVNILIFCCEVHNLGGMMCVRFSTFRSSFNLFGQTKQPLSSKIVLPIGTKLYEMMNERSSQKQQKIKMLTTDDRCHVMAITHKTLSVSVSAW